MNPAYVTCDYCGCCHSIDPNLDRVKTLSDKGWTGNLTLDSTNDKCPSCHGIDCYELDSDENLKRKVSKYHRLYQQANGKAIRYERTKDRLVRDKIFLKRKIWTILAVLPSDANWHNAPDYIQHFKAQMSAHAKQANHYQLLYNDLKLLLDRLKLDMAYRRKNSMSIDEARQMLLDFAESRVANTSYFSDIDKRDSVLMFIEEWRKENDS